jgi:alkylation response protein AidB-like acyl-CoA dehydrogenase
MEFGLSEDDRLLQDSVSRFLAAEVPLDRVRALAAAGVEGAGFDSTLWQGLADLGVLGLVVPERFGGSGQGFFLAALVAEALGGVVAPAPYVGTITAAWALLLGGSAAQQEQALPEIVQGKRRYALALAEAVAPRQNAGLKREDHTLHGESLCLIDALPATHILLATDDGTLGVVEQGAAGLAMRPMQTIDKTRSWGLLQADGAAFEPLGGDMPHAQLLRRTLAAARVLLAADTLGAAQVMLDKAVAYAKERKQFSRVIASFQAVKHMCAEMVTELEPARSLLWYAAHAQDHVVEEADLMACLAKAHLGDIGREIARIATEVHGGMGFTDLVGLHYWFKRIGMDRQLLGGPELTREEAARLQGWVAA